MSVKNKNHYTNVAKLHFDKKVLAATFLNDLKLL